MKIKRKLALLLATVMASTCIFAGIPAVAAPPELPEGGTVLFKSGFESADAAPITNEVVEGTLKNVGKGGVSPVLTTNITNKLVAGSIAGSEDFYDG